MFDYLNYKLKKNLFTPLFKFSKNYLPIVISLISLCFSFYTFKSKKNEELLKRETFSQTINFKDSSSEISNIQFSSINPSFIVDNLKIYFPTSVGLQPITCLTSKWNCYRFTSDLFNIIESQIGSSDTTHYELFDVVIYPIISLPVIIEFNYILESQVKTAYCLYTLKYKYVEHQHLKFEALNFRKQFTEVSQKKIPNILDYLNKTEGYYKSIFAESIELDTTVGKQKILDSSLINPLLCDCKHYLRSDYITYKYAAHKTKDSIAEILEDSTITSYELNYPRFITDSLDLIRYKNILNRQLLSIDRTKLASINSDLEKIQSYITDKNFCFLKKKHDRDCLINSIWLNPESITFFFELVTELKINIWKHYNLPPRELDLSN